MSAHSCVVATVAIAALAGSAIATPLNLSPTPPDVSSGFITVDYNATTGAFLASGFSLNLTLPGPSTTPVNGIFQLTATIDNSGNATGGTLLVTDGATVLFSSSSLSQFGFGMTDSFEFVFSSDGLGTLAPLGANIGTILVNTDLSFLNDTPSFGSSFSESFGAGNADTFVMIPLPSAGLATLAGLALVAGRRRRA